MPQTTLKLDERAEETILTLPVRGRSVKRNTANRAYAIKALETYKRDHPGSDSVIGYWGMRTGFGNIATDHRILEREEAERMKAEAEKDGLIFRYESLNDLLDAATKSAAHLSSNPPTNSAYSQT